MRPSQPVVDLFREPVALEGGLVVSLEALQLVWRVEDAGVVLLRRAGRVRAAPAERLTETDRALIRVHRDEVIALIRYGEEGRAP